MNAFNAPSGTVWEQTETVVGYEPLIFVVLDGYTRQKNGEMHRRCFDLQRGFCFAFGEESMMTLSCRIA